MVDKIRDNTVKLIKISKTIVVTKDKKFDELTKLVDNATKQYESNK